MATTTSNFGWDIPQSTDLVKDGATAIATLGQDIDTSMVDLKGGTTGQILSKTSNTDMDFTWINNDQGDITGVTAGTGLTGGGTSGSVTLDFDVANYGGGQYAAGKNKIINGNFAINQRAFTSTTTSNTYGFDRWIFTSVDGTCTYSAQTFTPGTAPVTGYEAANFARVQTTSQTLAGAFTTLAQRIESVRTFAGQTVTVSFWAKAASGTPKVAVELAQFFGLGGSPSAQVNNLLGTITLSTAWTRYSLSIALPSISGKTIGTTQDGSLNLNLWISAGTDFTARTGSIGIQSNTFDFWGVQVEAGSTATPFQTATGTIQGELAACQRYYWRYTPTGAGNNLGFGFADSTTSAAIAIPFKVTMRTNPTALETSGTAADYTVRSYGGAATACNSVPTFSSASTEIGLMAFPVASGLTAGDGVNARAANANAYLGWSAEL